MYIPHVTQCICLLSLQHNVYKCRYTMYISVIQCICVSPNVYTCATMYIGYIHCVTKINMHHNVYGVTQCTQGSPKNVTQCIYTMYVGPQYTLGDIHCVTSIYIVYIHCSAFIYIVVHFPVYTLCIYIVVHLYTL